MSSDMHDDAGHLTALGWTTFVLYLLAALLSFRAALLSNRSQASVVRSPSSFEARLWFWLGMVLAALGLNKPFDLQTATIELGRQVAGEENLSAHRRGLFLIFFLGFILALLALIMLVVSKWPAQLGAFRRRFPLAAAGGALVCLYIVIRASSIDHIDQMLGFDLERIPFLWLLEAGGLALIIFQALRRAKETTGR